MPPDNDEKPAPSFFAALAPRRLDLAWIGLVSLGVELFFAGRTLLAFAASCLALGVLRRAELGRSRSETPACLYLRETIR